MPGTRKPAAFPASPSSSAAPAPKYFGTELASKQ